MLEKIVTEEQRETITRIDKPSPEQFILKVGGKSFRCECNCNVFHKPLVDDPLVYECNACGATYTAEPPNPADATEAGGAGEPVPGSLVAALRGLLSTWEAYLHEPCCAEICETYRFVISLVEPYEARWQADRKRLESERDASRSEAQALHRERKGEVWYWQGDEEDHLESLTCPVLIEANMLREIMVDRTAMAELCAGVKALADKYRGKGGFITNFYSELALLLPGPESDARPAGAESEGETP